MACIKLAEASSSSGKEVPTERLGFGGVMRGVWATSLPPLEL